MGSPGSKITADFQGGDSKALCKYQVEGPGTVTSWCSSRGHTLFPASRCPAPARSPSRAVLPPRNLVPAAHTRFRLFRSPKAWVGPSIRGFPVNVGAGVCQQLRLGALARTHAHTHTRTNSHMHMYTCTHTQHSHTHSRMHTHTHPHTHTPHTHVHGCGPQVAASCPVLEAPPPHGRSRSAAPCAQVGGHPPIWRTGQWGN